MDSVLLEQEKDTVLQNQLGADETYQHFHKFSNRHAQAPILDQDQSVPRGLSCEEPDPKLGW